MKTLEVITRLLPQAKTCPNLTLSRGDILIQAPGFEDRTSAILGRVRSIDDSEVILLDYKPANPRNDLRGYREGLVSKGFLPASIHIIEYDRFDPSGFEVQLSSFLNQNIPIHVYLDISTMSKLAILISLKVCADMDVAVTVLYAEAQLYGPSYEEFDAARQKNEIHRPTLQIYNGIHGVVRSASLSSVAMQGQPTAAIVFMSFNDALTQVLLNTVYPSRLFLINGRPPVLTWREQATAWIHDEVRREWASDNPTHIANDGAEYLDRCVSTLDYVETIDLLIRLFWQLSGDHRILLAPAGSKMQTVGCYLVKRLHPDIHVEYPSPEGFSPEYSAGVGDIWALELGKLRALVNVVSSYERAHFLEINVSS
jgi:hypothetical protein